MHAARLGPARYRVSTCPPIEPARRKACRRARPMATPRAAWSTLEAHIRADPAQWLLANRRWEKRLLDPTWEARRAAILAGSVTQVNRTRRVLSASIARRKIALRRENRGSLGSSSCCSSCCSRSPPGAFAPVAASTGEEEEEVFTKSVNKVFHWFEDVGLMRRTPAYERDYHRTYPGLAELEAAHGDVKAECLALLGIKDKLTDMQELGAGYTAGGIHTAQWKAFMFASGGRFVDENCARAPKTTALLKRIPNMDNAFLLGARPGSSTSPRTGATTRASCAITSAS